MEKEKAIENGVKIYCIYFHNKESRYNIGKPKGKSTLILQEISQLGRTNGFYIPDSLNSLCDAFFKINEAIETNSRIILAPVYEKKSSRNCNFNSSHYS